MFEVKYPTTASFTYPYFWCLCFIGKEKEFREKEAKMQELQEVYENRLLQMKVGRDLLQKHAGAMA